MEEKSPIDLKRMLAFLGVSLLIFVGWSHFFPSPGPGDPGVDAAATRTAPAAAGSSAAPLPAAAADATGALDAAGAEAVPPGVDVPPAVAALSIGRRVVSTPLTAVEVTNRGGRVTSWKLLDHGEYGAKDLPLDVVKRAPSDLEGERPQRVSDDAPLLPLQVVTGDEALDRRLAEALHEIEVDESGGKARIALRWSDGQGTSIEKILTLAQGSHLAQLEAHLTVGGRPVPLRLAWGPGIGNHGDRSTKGPYFRRGEVVFRSQGKLHDVKDPAKPEALDQSVVQWAALKDSFFAVAFVPAPAADGRVGGADVGFHVGGVMPARANGKARKGSAWPDWLVLEAPFTPERPIQALYVGPVDRRLLPLVDEALGSSSELATLANVGFLEPIAGVMHSLMVWFHARTGSWGVSILLLTLVIRAALFPFTHASLKKMRGLQDRMGVIKPKIDQLKERYRKLPRNMDNRQREQQELLAIYQAAGVSPFASIGGCLPMLLSLPFFWALFLLLPRAAEFRHQPFLMWADLSAADPWYVLPLIMGVTMYYSSKLSVSSNAALDPINRNMMLYAFPIMFTWFCFSAPLGLVAYWTTSNLIQFGQQQLLNRTLPKAGGSEPPTDKPTKTAGRRAARS